MTCPQPFDAVTRGEGQRTNIREVYMGYYCAYACRSFRSLEPALARGVHLDEAMVVQKQPQPPYLPVLNLQAAEERLARLVSRTPCSVLFTIPSRSDKSGNLSNYGSTKRLFVYLNLAYRQSTGE